MRIPSNDAKSNVLDRVDGFSTNGAFVVHGAGKVGMCFADEGRQIVNKCFESIELKGHGAFTQLDELRVQQLRPWIEVPTARWYDSSGQER